MNSFNKIRYTLLSCFLILSFTSCIGEGDTDCPPTETGIRVYFSYPLAEETERDGTLIPAEQIDLFIFDEQGCFVKKLIDDSPFLTADYCMDVELAAGKYTFVSWINLKDCYYLSHPEIPEGTSLSDLLLHIQADENDTIHTSIHTLYFGNLTEVQTRENTLHTFLIPLMRNTYNLTVRTIGKEVNPEDDYFVVVSDRNGSYSFENSFASPREVHYKSTCILNEENQLQGALTALRLNEDENYATLKLQNACTGEIIYERNLVEMIQTYREQGMEIDFDTMFDFEVVLRFETDARVTVIINGWTMIEDQEELR